MQRTAVRTAADARCGPRIADQTGPYPWDLGPGRAPILPVFRSRPPAINTRPASIDCELASRSQIDRFEMTEHRENFENWFVETLKGLYPKRDAGFAILMIPFPLLERYLRQKSGIGEKVLDAPFYEELVKFIPELRDKVNACKFWHVFRNGLLHQVAISTENRRGDQMPQGILSHDFPKAVEVDSQGRFRVQPVELSERIISGIQADFAIYESTLASPHHPPPRIQTFDTSYKGTSS